MECFFVWASGQGGLQHAAQASDDALQSAVLVDDAQLLRRLGRFAQTSWEKQIAYSSTERRSLDNLRLAIH